MKRLPVIIILILVLASCSKVPGSVIQPEEMAQLMADVHTGEAMLEMNRQDYPNDSMKLILRQSIYARHGVTAAEVDSSFGWYGRNITYYMDVYDRTIEILENRLIESGNRIAADAALSIAGDSVDVWAGPRMLRITDRMPSNTIVFSIRRDDNWQRGDSYTWRGKFFNNTDSRWQIAAEYADGTIDYIEQTAQDDGTKELTFIGDSLRDATKIYGFLEVHHRAPTATVLDSLSLVRKRVSPVTYSRRYMIRRLQHVLPEQTIEQPDSAVTDSLK